jgi:putative component of toxin-antitoxin plasmid stabilization module
MDASTRGRFEAKLDRIEADETINPNWLKPYTGLSMWEIRFDHGGRAFRVLCEKRDKEFVMLLATAKDEQISDEEESRACRLRDKLNKGEASVREYPLAGRPSRDMEIVL